ncbi:MAG: hypothetical protein OES09_04180, partial [Gammaproteobacteria bacterium]|nr:hypothetical protein [Gammaproteobacteria bacterium]
AAGNHLNDIADQLAVEAHNQGIPATAFELRLTGLEDHARQVLNREAERRLVRAVATPGSPLQRFAYRLAAGLTYILPLGAIVWAGMHVVTRFYSATEGDEAFLGFGFITHTLVLVGLAWSFAWLLKRLARPSLVTSVRKALQAAARDMIEQSTARLDSVCAELDGDRQKLKSGLTAILTFTGESGVSALHGLVFPQNDRGAR